MPPNDRRQALEPQRLAGRVVDRSPRRGAGRRPRLGRDQGRGAGRRSSLHGVSPRVGGDREAKHILPVATGWLRQWPAGAAWHSRARGPAAARAGRSTRPLPGSAGSRPGPDSRRSPSVLTIFSAICSGVPIRPVLKPSLYWTRSSKLELAHMPCLSGDDLPACFTASPKPCTASTSALAMISRSTSCASRSVSRAMMKALAPKRRRRPLAAAAGVELVDLRLVAVERVAVHEVPVGHPRRHCAGRGRVAALEDLGVRVGHRLRLQVEVVEAVEVAAEVEAVLGPDAAQRADELLRPAIALVMLEPGLAHRGELALEPAADHVHAAAAVRELVGGGDELGEHARMPQARDGSRR